MKCRPVTCSGRPRSCHFLTRIHGSLNRQDRTNRAYYTEGARCQNLESVWTSDNVLEQSLFVSESPALLSQCRGFRCHIRFFTGQDDFREIVDILDLRPAPVGLQRAQRSVIHPQSSVFIQRQFHIVAKNRPNNVAMGDEEKSAARHFLGGFVDHASSRAAARRKSFLPLAGESLLAT